MTNMATLNTSNKNRNNCGKLNHILREKEDGVGLGGGGRGERMEERERGRDG